MQKYICDFILQKDKDYSRHNKDLRFFSEYKRKTILLPIS